VVPDPFHYAADKVHAEVDLLRAPIFDAGLIPAVPHTLIEMRNHPYSPLVNLILPNVFVASCLGPLPWTTRVFTGAI